MSDHLKDIIIKQISQHGPMDIGQYMSLCLGHPKFGYYMRKDPFVASGDFTTAPEVSQMFGEIIGAWVADIWMQAGQPDKFCLLECGPGRGTLMADIMRVTRKVECFHNACGIHLLEMSPVLKSIQKKLLNDYDVLWVQTLNDVPEDMPCIILANEFFDALPVRQIEFKDGLWAERVVSVTKDDSLTIGHRPAGEELVHYIPEGLKPKSGDIYEIAPARATFVKNLSQILQKQGGAALIIDYGHVRSNFGDTLQAVENHQYVDPLNKPGEADLTTHVDFETLVSSCEGAAIQGPVTQGHFLNSLGIKIRAQTLLKQADPEQMKEIESALKRLCDPDQMGEMFKVIGLSHGTNITPAGF